MMGLRSARQDRGRKKEKEMRQHRRWLVVVCRGAKENKSSGVCSLPRVSNLTTCILVAVLYLYVFVVSRR